MQELLEAQERLLKKREELKVTGNPIPSIMNFRDYIPKCAHGIKMDIVCEKCHEIKIENQRNESDWEKKDREEDEKRRIEERKKHKENPELYMKKIPLKFRDKSFDNFTGSDEVKKILRAYSDGFIHNPKIYGWHYDSEPTLVQYPGSVLLTGKTGCGKTHLAVAIIRELIIRWFDVGDCFFITAPELLLEIRSTYDKKIIVDRECETENEVLDKYSNCELLILDDLGAEKSTDFAIQSLYLIIDRRNRELRPTIVTTNLSLQEIEEKIDARMASRLADMKVIKLNMPDYRKKRG